MGGNDRQGVQTGEQEQQRKFFKSLQLSERFPDLVAKSPVMTKFFETAGKSMFSDFTVSKEELTQFWMDAVPMLTEVVYEAVEGMRAQALEKRDTPPNKFGNFQLGPLEVFYKGLDGMIGLPKLDIMEAMKREHASTETFTAYNQGLTIHTSPLQEWERVLPDKEDGPINNKDWYGNEMCADFQETEEAKRAGLMKEEIIALRLYSGPMYVKFNGTLRSAGSIISKAIEEQGDTDVDAAMASVRHSVGEASEFVTTLHTLVSGLLKLSQSAPPMQGSVKAYRGVHGRLTPKQFLDGSGGVEYAFLSTTVDMNTAVTYATQRERPMIFEIDFGMVDHGADIRWASYFPQEAEVLLPPLCMLEVTGAQRFQRTPNGVWVSVWPLKLNLNLQCLTLDQLLTRRKTLHLSMTRNLIDEVDRELRAQVEGDQMVRLDSSVRHHGVEGMEEDEKRKAMEVVMQQCEDVFQMHEAEQANYFNKEANYKKALDESMMVRRFASTRYQNLCRLADAPAAAAATSHTSKRNNLWAVIASLPLKALQDDAWRFAEVSGEPEWRIDEATGIVTADAKHGAKTLWQRLCSKEEIAKLKIIRNSPNNLAITPDTVSDHVLAVLVECMSTYPTGLRKVEFGNFKFDLRNSNKGLLNLGFQTDGNPPVKLVITHVKSFGADAARFVAALLEQHSKVASLDLAFCDMSIAGNPDDPLAKSLQPKLQEALLGPPGGSGVRKLKRLSLAYCGLHADALQAVAAYIELNPDLEYLDLAGNETSKEGCALIAKALCSRSGCFVLNQIELPLDDPHWNVPDLQTFGPNSVELLAAVVEHNSKLRSLNKLHPPADGSVWDLRRDLGLDFRLDAQQEQEDAKRLFGRLVGAGCTPIAVWASAADESGWCECGRVVAADGAAHVACEVHRNAILDAARDLHHSLRTKGSSLKIGVQNGTESGAILAVAEQPRVDSRQAEKPQSSFVPLKRNRGWASIDIPVAFVRNQPAGRIDLGGRELIWSEEENSAVEKAYRTEILRSVIEEWALADLASYLATEKATIQSKDFSGPLLLQLAKLGHKEGVQKVFGALGKECDIHYEEKGQTALSLAAYCCSEWYLKTGFKVHVHPQLGTKLQAPTVRDQTGRVIFDPRIDTHKRSNDFRGCLHPTVCILDLSHQRSSTVLNQTSSCLVDTVALLLNNGMRAKVNKDKPSALVVAAGNGQEHIVDLIFDVPHAIGGDFRATDATTLVQAAAGGHVSTVRLLLRKGVDVNGKHMNFVTLPLPDVEPTIFNEFNFIPEVKERYKNPTALIMAVAINNEEMVARLLDEGADVNLHCAITLPEHNNAPKDSKGMWTPLIVAASKGYLRIVQRLLAVPKLEVAQKHDALEQAIGRGHSEVAAVLVEHGDKDSLPWWWTAMHSLGLQGWYF